LIEAVSALVEAIDGLEQKGTRMVAIDGHSAAGKSTLAAEVARHAGAAVIDGDDFYAGGTASQWDAMSPAEKVDHCIGWRRQRPVLEALARGETATWHAYDWEANDGRLMTEPSVCSPAAVVILEGVYSARPELADLFHLRVLFDAPAQLRDRRWAEREGEGHADDWARRWSEAEDWYFTHVMPTERFDLILPA
jgi:uridine kinase